MKQSIKTKNRVERREAAYETTIKENRQVAAGGHPNSVKIHRPGCQPSEYHRPGSQSRRKSAPKGSTIH